MTGRRPTILLLLACLWGLSTCKPSAVLVENPFEIFCQRLTASEEDRSLSWDQKDREVQKLHQEMVPRAKDRRDAEHLARLAVLDAKYAHYAEFAAAIEGLHTIRDPQRADFFEQAATTAVGEAFTCPGARRHWQRYSDPAALAAACATGSLDACYVRGQAIRDPAVAIPVLEPICERDRDPTWWKHGGACMVLGQRKAEAGDIDGAAAAYARICGEVDLGCAALALLERRRGRREAAHEAFLRRCGESWDSTACKRLAKKLAGVE